MKKFLKKSLGFTLIELLIVIALLGVLAVALLAALDPLEQIRKGNDTGVRNIASEIHGGIIRVFANRGEMPWDATDDDLEEIAGLANNATIQDQTIDVAVTAGELKSGFVELAGDRLQFIHIAGQDSGETGDVRDPQVIVCYRPQSRSQKCDQNTLYQVDATQLGLDSVSLRNDLCGPNAAPTACGETEDCWWCVGDVPTTAVVVPAPTP